MTSPLSASGRSRSRKLFRGSVLFSIFLVLIVFLSVVEIHFIKREALSITIRVIMLILFNINIIALLTLMFFVAKTLTKLYLERKQKVLGSKFKTKIVVIFVVLTSIPSILLFLGASGLVTNYIDRWFTPQFRQPIDSTLDIAKAIYEIEREKTLIAAKAFISQKKIPSEYKVLHLEKAPDNPSDILTDAFDGREGTEVISGENGDIVRAIVPEMSKGRPAGVIIVESRISGRITKNVEAIKNAYEDYAKLETWKQPLKLNYLLFLGFFTLIVIFTALWVSLRIARGITEPIQYLAQATDEVASGNLDVSIGINRADEIGFLIGSFNHMVKELKEGKKSLQEAYSESDRRRLSMENIVENIRSGVISINAEGNIIAINSSACSILNVAAGDIIGRGYEDILSLIKSDPFQEMVRGIRLKTFRQIEKEVRVNISGRRAILRVSIMGLRDNAANYLGLLVVFDDLTDMIKAQKAFAWQEVARRIAHEIKNPLTPIRLSTERMLKKWENRDEDFANVFRRSTHTIIKEVDGLKRLVDEFSRFGKMPEIVKSPASLSGIIDEAINLFRDYKGVTVKTALPDNMPPIDIDREQFKRVFINLFDNALHAMNNSGNIDVRVNLNTASNRVLIDIADNGPGIKEEDKEKLFLPYFSTKDSGTGLGLTIASRIIAEHGGYIRVSNNKPKGTVFTIEIPAGEG